MFSSIISSFPTVLSITRVAIWIYMDLFENRVPQIPVINHVLFFINISIRIEHTSLSDKLNNGGYYKTHDMNPVLYLSGSCYPTSSPKILRISMTFSHDVPMTFPWRQHRRHRGTWSFCSKSRTPLHQLGSGTSLGGSTCPADLAMAASKPWGFPGIEPTLAPWGF